MFKKLFKLFNKNITPVPQMHEHFVFNYPLKRKRIRINSSVEVPENFLFAVVVNGKVLDIVSEGRYRVNGSTMPGVFAKLNLGKPNKKGKLKKYFKAQGYYVNTNVFEDKHFTSNVAFHLRSEEFGRVKGYAEGVANIQIKNIDELFKYLLKRVNVAKHKNVEHEIGLLVGNAVNAFIERNKVNMTDILLKPGSLHSVLNPAVDDLLYEIGLGAEHVSLMSLKLTKKMQKRVNEFLSNNANIGINLGGESVDSENINKIAGNNNQDTENAENQAVLLKPADGVSGYISTQNQTNNLELKANENVGNENLANNTSKQTDAERTLPLMPNTNRFNFGADDSEKTNNNKLPNDLDERINSLLSGFGESKTNKDSTTKSSTDEGVVNSDDAVMTSYLNKRASDAELVNSSLNLGEQESYKKERLDAEKVLKSQENKLKQCKYCGTAIEVHFKFCPKCGFKQA